MLRAPWAECDQLWSLVKMAPILAVGPVSFVAMTALSCWKYDWENRLAALQEAVQLFPLLASCLSRNSFLYKKSHGGRRTASALEAPVP